MDSESNRRKSKFVVKEVIKPRSGDAASVVIHTGRRWLPARSNHDRQAGVIGHAITVPIIGRETAFLNKLTVLNDGSIEALAGGTAPVKEGAVVFKEAVFPNGPAMRIEATDVVSVTRGREGRVGRSITIVEFKEGYIDRVKESPKPPTQS